MASAGTQKVKYDQDMGVARKPLPAVTQLPGKRSLRKEGIPDLGRSTRAIL